MRYLHSFLAVCIAAITLLFVFGQLSYQGGRQLRSWINALDIKGGYLPLLTLEQHPQPHTQYGVEAADLVKGQHCNLPPATPLTCAFTPRYNLLTVKQLRPLARAAGIKSPQKFKKAELIALLSS